MKLSWRSAAGWGGYIIALGSTCLWAFWGIIENFHEGWYADSLGENLRGTLAYLSPCGLFLGLTLLAVVHPRIGAAIWAVAGAGVILYFHNYVIAAPFFVLALLFGVGTFRPGKWTYRLVFLLPAVTVLVCGIEPAWRVSGRDNDGNFDMRIVEGNDVRLAWAPAGPGFPQTGGAGWDEAVRICRYLSADGSRLENTPQDIWRLPTLDEAVRSMSRHGANCGGRLDPKTGQPRYNRKPDKETPLWNPHSPVIYWWTATEIDSTHAWMIVYHGGAFQRHKQFRPGSLGFRAVRTEE